MRLGQRPPDVLNPVLSPITDLNTRLMIRFLDATDLIDRIESTILFEFIDLVIDDESPIPSSSDRRLVEFADADEFNETTSSVDLLPTTMRFSRFV